MKITEKNRYLVVPTCKTAELSKVYIIMGEKLLLDLDVKLSFENPDSVFYYDLKPFMGLDVEVTNKFEKSFGFSEKALEPSCDEERPLLHFSAPRGWLNDPNGLCFYEGKYHLFYQHNPVGLEWGNMHWGHAVGTDLIHWEDKGDVLYPDEMGDMFSGSAIVDTDNLLGLKENEHDPLLLFYTANGSGREISADKKAVQCIAYSTDGGETFKKWDKNPVVDHIRGGNRDPKVIRDPKSGAYVMALYLDGYEYSILTSTNLSEWKELQKVYLPGDNECPDFYPLIDETGDMKWIFTGAHDCALIGDFDIEKGFYGFGDPEKAVMRFGFNAPYAAQSFNLGDDIRRIRIAWNRIYPKSSKNFTCSMGIPTEVTLRGGKLHLAPVAELNSAFDRVGELVDLPSHGISREISVPSRIYLELSKLEEPISINICETEFKLDPSGLLRFGEYGFPITLSDGKASLDIIVDRLGIEIFDGAGRTYAAFNVVPNGNTLTIGGEGSLDRLTISEKI